MAKVSKVKLSKKTNTVAIFKSYITSDDSNKSSIPFHSNKRPF